MVSKSRYLICILLLAVGSHSSCSKPMPQARYTIAINQLWPSLPLFGREGMLSAFMLDLLKAVERAGNLPLKIELVSHVGFVEAMLDDCQADAIGSAVPSQALKSEIYLFSPMILATGPVLIMRKDDPQSDLTSASIKRIGLLENSDDYLTLAGYQNIITQPYSNIEPAIYAVLSGKLDGVLIDRLRAHWFCSNEFFSTLTIVTPPLNHAGIRLIALKNEKTEPFMRKIEEILDSIYASEEINHLLNKWNLPPQTI